MKQIIVATSSNHADIIVIHGTSRECVWLRSMTQHILQLCSLSMQTMAPTIFYEENVACIAQLNGAFIKGDRTKNISPNCFYTTSSTK